MQNFFDPKFSFSKFWIKEKYWHEISFESKKILVKKIRVQKISFVPQEKLLGLEKIFRPKKYGSKTNLDKKGFSLQKKFGLKEIFCSDKAHIDMTTTLRLLKFDTEGPRFVLSSKSNKLCLCRPNINQD